ncbi:Abi family protein [Culicoidibacter larvae]|uniref:Abi family protein n=1 Tax=Culicoidibacter larvae TaxID=2579976 RepID=A0A5R8QF38_9FIRM|nr:Abi family protein [Culicoidibacter larvae]TLG76651.1 hypothetical protein FEZ08_03285 [Culicoidibacter larvae]
MNSVFPKYRSIDERLDILISDGLQIDDRASAKAALERVDYFRMMRFAPMFEDENRHFFPGTTFADLENIYEFDRYIRHIIMQCIDPIEVALRAQLSDLVGTRYGSDGYRHREHFQSAQEFKEFYRKLEKKFTMRNVYEVIDDVHVSNIYELPVWVAFELCTLQMLELFYTNLKKHDQKEIARIYGFSYRDLPSWLHYLVVIRNTAAHQGRFVDRHFNDPATLDRFDERQFPDFVGNDLFAAFYVCTKFLSTVDVDLIFMIINDLKEELHDSNIELKKIGFPESWYEQLLSILHIGVEQ